MPHLAFCAPQTVADLLSSQARVRPTAVAIEALDGRPATYAALAGQAGRTRRALRAFGVRPTDRVAIVLPDSAEAAVMFLTVAACAVAAPLNPAYREAEFAFHFDDLSVRAVIVPAGSTGAVIAVAHARGLAIIEMSRRDGQAGLFDLSCERHAGAVPDGDASVAPDATALLLHTSGTTARPKLVSLTHANLCAAARQNNAVVDLGPDDRALAVMPLFHVGGLIRSLFSPLYAGGSVVRTPGFQAPRFLEWLQIYRPTWYAAGPTTQRAILDQVQKRGLLPVRSTLRFVQVGSAPTRPALHAALEQAFGVPILTRYGMTETAGQITSNPLPPQLRKPGSVGQAVGVDVSVMDKQGRMLGHNQIGEIVVRGPNVIRAYESSPEVNATAFVNGWFRTGDQGYQDEDGYFFLTGRLKEVINRGGEKIAPREVDDVLLDHPSVAHAVTFAMPDARLGEAVAAAVVPNPGATLDELDLREFVARRLAFFKVPARIVVLDELPTGPTGKIQRIGMAARVGLLDAAPPAGDGGAMQADDLVERRIGEIAAEVLGVAGVDTTLSFLDCGGDSVMLAQLVARIRDLFSVDVTLIEVFDAPSLAAVAGLVTHRVLREIESPSGTAA